MENRLEQVVSPSCVRLSHARTGFWVGLLPADCHQDLHSDIDSDYDRSDDIDHNNQFLNIHSDSNSGSDSDISGPCYLHLRQWCAVDYLHHGRRRTNLANYDIPSEPSERIFGHACDGVTWLGQLRNLHKLS